jgi:PAS domain S-box-containing protein
VKRTKTDLDKRFLETILGSVADGVFTVDQQRRITSFNRAAERITGVSASEAIGKKCHDVFHADVCEQRCALQRTMESGRQIIDVPARILSNKGRSIPISLSTALLRDSNGNLLGAVETFRDLSALEQLRREISQQYTFQDIVGKSKGMQRIFAILPDIAESDATVLIEGPSGSGKELLARAVHSFSLRHRKPLVAVNCGALPETLFESELFGYAKGAFTDAKRNKAGRLALAEGGTLFLDEVSELSPATQVKLLRVLQEREYEPLGSVKTVQSNVRVIAATNSRLAELVSNGRFRDDLYFRLAVVRLTIPSLNERKEDIPYLVEHFIEKFNAKRGKNISGVTPECMELFMRHEFTGNVRELENLIEYAFVLCHNQQIDVRHLPEDFQNLVQPSAESQPPQDLSRLKWAEADAIQAALRRNRYDMGRTARDLKVSRTTLWRKIKRYGIETPPK